jgi:hypothetical protein
MGAMHGLRAVSDTDRKNGSESRGTRPGENLVQLRAFVIVEMGVGIYEHACLPENLFCKPTRLMGCEIPLIIIVRIILSLIHAATQSAVAMLVAVLSLMLVAGGGLALLVMLGVFSVSGVEALRFLDKRKGK